MADPKARLEQAIRGPVPPAVAALPAEQLEHLATAVEAALTQQRAALDRAVDDGLGFVPRLLRGAVKKAVTG